MDEKQIFIIDSSQLNDWDLCKHKYYLRHILYEGQGLAPISRERSLDIGGVIHELLRVYYFLRKRGGIEHERIVRACIKRGRHYLSKHSDLSAEDSEFVLFTFKEYTDYYRRETWIPQEVELPFVKKIHEDENFIFLIQGKVDLIISIPGIPGLIIVDHKTRSRFRAESKLDNQKLIYSKFLGIDTFIINQIGLFKTKPPKEKFLRPDPISYSEDFIGEWYNELIMTLKEIVAYKKLNFFKRNPSSCDKWAGCIFKQWCNEEPKRRENLINMTYKIGETWDVGKGLEKNV